MTPPLSPLLSPPLAHDRFKTRRASWMAEAWSAPLEDTDRKKNLCKFSGKSRENTQDIQVVPHAANHRHGQRTRCGCLLTGSGVWWTTLESLSPFKTASVAVSSLEESPSAILRSRSPCEDWDQRCAAQRGWIHSHSSPFSLNVSQR